MILGVLRIFIRQYLIDCDSRYKALVLTAIHIDVFDFLYAILVYLNNMPYLRFGSFGRRLRAALLVLVDNLLLAWTQGIGVSSIKCFIILKLSLDCLRLLLLFSEVCVNCHRQVVVGAVAFDNVSDVTVSILSGPYCMSIINK